MRKEKINLYILAGGKSSRMQQDKSLMKLKGKSFLAHIIKAAKGLQLENTYIVGKQEKHACFGLPVLEDIYKEIGPVGGIHTALKHCKKDLALVVSCDVPLIKTEVLEKLINNWEEGLDQIQYEYRSKAMPLVAIYKKNCLSQFKSAIEKNKLKLMAIVNQLNNKTILANEEEGKSLTNINTKLDLEKII